MKNKILLLIGIAPAILPSCKPAPCADVLIKKDTTVKSERENTLFAFVGEKIEIKHIPSEEIVMDSEFRAKYKVLQKIYGCYTGDTIEFTAFDHYGWPDFSQYKNALLYLSEFEGKYYHEKYQYDDVYMTRSGKWAGPYASYDASRYIELSIIPRRVDYADTVSFPIYLTDTDGSIYHQDYPHPFYWTVGEQAIAQYGISVEDLFKVKKEFVLTARGLFGEEKDHQLIPQDLQLAEVKVNPEEDKLDVFWNKFANQVIKGDSIQINKVLLDSLWVCGTLFTKQKLMSGCFREIFDSSLVAEFKRRISREYTFEEINLSELLPSVRRQIIKNRQRYRKIKIELYKRDNPRHDLANLYLTFIETKSGLRLYDIRYPRNRSCCF